MEQEVSKKKTIVLKSQIGKSELEQIVNKKKTGLFGSLVKRPKPSEVRVDSISLFYERYWRAAGQYVGDYFRSNEYQIDVEPTVTEVKIGKGIFPVREESGTWKKLKRGMKAGIGKKTNKLDLPVEEHVELGIVDEIVLDPNGKETEFDYKINSKTIENFPDAVLEENKKNIRMTKLDESLVIQELAKILREDVDEKIHDVKEKITIDTLEEIFVPVYEARCVGPKDKVVILRIDGVSKRVI